MGDFEDFDRAVREAYEWRCNLYRAGTSGAEVIRAFEERIRGEPDVATLRALQFELKRERAAQRKKAHEEATGRPDALDQMFRWICIVDRIIPGIERFDQITAGGGQDWYSSSAPQPRKSRGCAPRAELHLGAPILGEFTVSEAIYLELF